MSFKQNVRGLNYIKLDSKGPCFHLNALKGLSCCSGFALAAGFDAIVLAYPVWFGLLGLLKHVEVVVGIQKELATFSGLEELSRNRIFHYWVPRRQKKLRAMISHFDTKL